MKSNKKFLIYFICCILICSAFLTGCSSQSFIEKFSTNVNEYNIEISVNEINKTAKVSQTTIYVNNTDDGLDNVCFHIYPKSFCEGVKNKPVSTLYETKAYSSGKSYGTFDLTKVCVNGKTIEPIFEGEDESILKVNLGSVLYPNDKIEVSFEYDLTLPNINHRYGYGENTINLGNFYLMACVYENGCFNKTEYHYNGDPFYSDMANYNVVIKTNEDYKVATTGNVISSIIKDNELTTTVEAKAVRDFDIIISDKFEILKDKVNNTEITYYYYKDENPEKSLQTAVDAVKTFNDLIGEYPYETLNVVESNFVHGGMEYPNLVMISDDLEKYEDYTNTIIHEIAHQWWYGMVGNNEYQYGWLDEGLTEYTTALFYENNESYGLKYDEIVNSANSSYCMFVEVYDDIFGKVDTSMNRALNEYDTEPEYIYISYVKGMLLFDSLRDVLGTKTFMKCLKNYFKEYQGYNATPQSLIASFESTSHRNLEGFFNSFINGTVVIVPKESPRTE